VTELPISSWRARCINSRLTGLIVLPSFSIISESIGSGKRDGTKALVNDALLLSADRRHFEKVPGLRVEVPEAG
jgi:hypothetical protein